MSFAKNGKMTEQFEYTVNKAGKAFIKRSGKMVKILSEKDTAKMLKRIKDVDNDAIQLELARVTGNYKRGNERLAKIKEKRDLS